MMMTNDDDDLFIFCVRAMRKIESLYSGSFARSEHVGLAILHGYRKEIATVGNRALLGKCGY